MIEKQTLDRYLSFPSSVSSVVKILADDDDKLKIEFEITKISCRVGRMK